MSEAIFVDSKGREVTNPSKQPDEPVFDDDSAYQMLYDLIQAHFKRETAQQQKLGKLTQQVGALTLQITPLKRELAN